MGTALLEGGLGKWRYLRSQGWAPVAEVLGLLAALGLQQMSYGDVVETYGQCFQRDLGKGATASFFRKPIGCPLSWPLWLHMFLATRYWERRLYLRLWLIEQE